MKDIEQITDIDKLDEILKEFKIQIKIINKYIKASKNDKSEIVTMIKKRMVNDLNRINMMKIKIEKRIQYLKMENER